MLELDNITKEFGAVKAVDAVSFAIREGEMLGLVGPNGSGKSTLLKIILGLARPSSGRLLLEGKELTAEKWKTFRSWVGYMPERVSFYDNLTGRETVELFARVKGGDVGSLNDIFKKVGLETACDRKVGGYSKGMRQRLNLAQAVSNDPDILVLDEPSSGLDPVGTKEFYTILDNIRERKRLTVILSSHILAEIEDRIDRVAVIKAGRLAGIGSLTELYEGFNLPLKIFIAVKAGEDSLQEILRGYGAGEMKFEGGILSANIPRTDKLRILSALMDRKDSFTDISMKEPNLEEVFFGVH